MHRQPLRGWIPECGQPSTRRPPPIAMKYSRTLITGFALILLLSAGDLRAQSGDAGSAAYNRGDYAEAYRNWLPLAEQGNAAAQYNVALLYEDGLGVAQNYARAAHWYRLSAEQGDVDAQFSLGLMYNVGRGVPQDHVQAVYWYRQAAVQGDANAQFNLGAMYNNGHGVVQNSVQAMYWFNLAAEQGHPAVDEALATISIAEAYATADAAYDRGDYAEAYRLWLPFAEQGHVGVQALFGYMYSQGLGVAQNDVQAAHWYRRAADQGHAGAQYNLGTLYFNGRGVPRSNDQAIEWFARAAEQGHADAQNALAIARRPPEPVRTFEDGVIAFNEERYHDAFMIVSPLSREGHAGAQYVLGALHLLGRNIPYNPEEARRLFTLSARQGYNDARLALERMGDLGR